MSLNKVYERELAFQADRRRATVEFINIVSDLWYDKSIELVLFRKPLHPAVRQAHARARFGQRDETERNF